jgi:hypothetical protein
MSKGDNAMFTVIQTMLRRIFGRSQAWTTNQLVNLGNNLANGFGPGTNVTKSEAEVDTWTTQKLVHMGESMSHIHPGI